MQKVFCDTNVLHKTNKFKFEDYSQVFISIVSIEELDHQKSDDRLGYSARQALRNIRNANNVKIITDYSYSGVNRFLNHGNDNVILGMAYETWIQDKEVVFLSDDYNLIIKAEALELPCSLFEFKKDENGIYKGYKTLQGGTYFINELFENVEKGINEYNFVCNEYLILYNSDTGKISEHRYNGSKFVDLKLPDSKVIKGKNSLQRCSLDLLNNKDISIVAINGTVGSGKTYLCIRMGLYHVNDKSNANKVLAVREALGEGKEVGFLRGTFEDKTKMFFKPIEQSLKGGEFELQALVQQNKLESNIPYYLKGTTYSDTIMVCDESEDLSKKQLKLVGTRLGENSRIFFAGDYKQSSIDASERNALVQMCNELKGNSNFGCIYLDDDVRSVASKIFANLFENY